MIFTWILQVSRVNNKVYILQCKRDRSFILSPTCYILQQYIYLRDSFHSNYINCRRVKCINIVTSSDFCIVLNVQLSLMVMMMMILSIVCFIALCQLYIQVQVYRCIIFRSISIWFFFEMVFIQHTLYETVNQSKLSIGVDGQLKIFNWNFIAVLAAHTHTHMLLGVCLRHKSYQKS